MIYWNGSVNSEGTVVYKSQSTNLLIFSVSKIRKQKYGYIAGLLIEYMAKMLKQGVTAVAIVLAAAIALLGLCVAIVGFPTSYIRENDIKEETIVPRSLYCRALLCICGGYDYWRALVRETADCLVWSRIPLCYQCVICV
jgi:hypothetical protein